MSSSQPLHIYDSLETLTHKIAQFESADPRKRIGANQTVVFAVKKLECNPKYEVLDENDLDFWLNLRQGVVEILSDQDDDEEDDHNIVDNDHHQRIDDFVDQQAAESVFLTDESIECLDSPEVVAKCDVDQLVISEFVDDEYKENSDREDTDNELSKNIKKIRSTKAAPIRPIKQVTTAATSESPVKLEQKIKIKHRPKNFGLQCSSSTRISTNPDASWATKPAEKTAPSPEKPAATFQPDITHIEPDWDGLSQSLPNGCLKSTFKYLLKFKSLIRGNAKACQLLKDFTTKCINEDETEDLLNTLKLEFDVGNNSDTDHMTELVKRFKRKLFWQTSTIPNYKGKTNPEQIYRNYKDAMSFLAERAKDTHTLFKLCYSEMLFLIDPNKVCQQNQLIIPTMPTPPSLTPESDSNCLNPRTSTPILTKPLLQQQTQPSIPSSAFSDSVKCKRLLTTSDQSNVPSKLGTSEYKLLKIETKPVDKVDEKLPSGEVGVKLPVRKVSECISASGRVTFKVHCRKRVIKT